MSDAYVRERAVSVCENVKGVGETTAPGVPVALSRTPMRIGDPPRRPGSDAARILEEIGMADAMRNSSRWLLCAYRDRLTPATIIPTVTPQEASSTRI